MLCWKVVRTASVSERVKRRIRKSRAIGGASGLAFLQNKLRLFQTAFAVCQNLLSPQADRLIAGQAIVLNFEATIQSFVEISLAHRTFLLVVLRYSSDSVLSFRLSANMRWPSGLLQRSSICSPAVNVIPGVTLRMSGCLSWVLSFIDLFKGRFSNPVVQSFQVLPKLLAAVTLALEVPARLGSLNLVTSAPMACKWPLGALQINGSHSFRF